MHQDRQDIRRRNIAQWPRDRLGEFNVRIELRNQLADKRHVYRTRDHVDSVRPHIRCELDFADDDRILGKRGQPAEIVSFKGNRLLGLRLDAGTDVAHSARNRRRPRGRLVSFLENLLQHVDHFGRIGALKFDELAHHFRRRDVHLIDHVDQSHG